MCKSNIFYIWKSEIFHYFEHKQNYLKLPSCFTETATGLPTAWPGDNGCTFRLPTGVMAAARAVSSGTGGWFCCITETDPSGFLLALPLRPNISHSQIFRCVGALFYSPSPLYSTLNPPHLCFALLSIYPFLTSVLYSLFSSLLLALFFGNSWSLL